MERSPIRRLGGKHAQAPFIVSRIPPHRIYVEPFAGAAAVFFRKGRLDIPGYREVLNDLDEGIYSFFKALREHPETLAARLAMTPFSRREARAAIIREGDDEMARAVKTAVALYQTFAGKTNLGGKPAGWSFGRQSQDHPVRWSRVPEQILGAAARLKEVYLDCLDFERCIRLWDTPQTFFFVDPPYVGCEAFYPPTFTPDDHQRLARALNSIKGRALVTYYDNDLVRKLYRKWRIEVRQVTSRATRSRSGQLLPRRSEVYLMNYDAGGERL